MQTPLMHNSDVGIVICHATINFKQIYCGNSIEWRAIWFETTKIWFQTILHDTKFSCITVALKSLNLIALIQTFGQYWYFVYSVAKKKKRKRMRKMNFKSLFCFVLLFQLRFRESLRTSSINHTCETTDCKYHLKMHVKNKEKRNHEWH